MSEAFLSYGRQSIDEDDIAEVQRVLSSDFLTTGPIGRSFESALSDRFDGAEVISCSSGSAALHLALLALGLGPGDWAVVPSITFLATASAVRHTGADVIFCDVDPDSGLMTAATLERALDENKDKRVRAILPVHLAGQPVNPFDIEKIARRDNIFIVEDACHALGTFYYKSETEKRYPIGGCLQSDLATFSFHPVKTMTTGEGGAIAARNPNLIKQLRIFRNHGIIRDFNEFENNEMSFDSEGTQNPWYYEMLNLGMNYRLSDINAALGLSQLKKLDKFILLRQKIVEHYDKRLADLSPILKKTKRVLNSNVSWHLYQVLIDFKRLRKSRAIFMEELKEKNIGSQVHYIPVHLQPYYLKRYGKQNLPGSLAFYERTLTLPNFVGMGIADVDRVVESIKDILK